MVFNTKFNNILVT